MSIFTKSGRRAALMGLALAMGLGGITAAVAPAASAAVIDPEVWVGSPVQGTWNASGYNHHWLSQDKDQGDWAGDIAVGAGSHVALYAAPQAGGYTVTTRVDQIGPACGGGANGASFVNVGIYVNGARIGSASYGHLNPMVGVGQWVNRWGTVLGTVAGGLPHNTNCWTGPHVHMQSFNVHGYSCFNRGYGQGSPLNHTNFVSMVGGRRVGGARQACP